MCKALIAVLAVVALSANGQTSPRDFANGPAKWLMTSEEQKVWRDVNSDDQAAGFIDLFWARRDPTPGTGRNENRLEFEQRVAFADAHALDPSAGRTQAAKETWEYDHELAAKYGMPKIDVVFIFDRLNGGAHRDPQRTDFTSALPGAIRSYIRSPELTTAPDWASSRLAQSRANVSSNQVLGHVPGAVAEPAGVGRMTLLNDSMAIQPQSGLHPFAPFTTVTEFRRGNELGWAAEYCSGRMNEAAPALKVQLRATAANGDSFSTDPEEFVPDWIKAWPGCYLGAVTIWFAILK